MPANMGCSKVTLKLFFVYIFLLLQIKKQKVQKEKLRNTKHFYKFKVGMAYFSQSDRDFPGSSL